ncbi:MAG: calcium-binding protein [Lysobacter sp.]
MRWKQWAVMLVLALAPAMGLAQTDGSDDDGIDAAVTLLRAEAGAHRLILLGEKHGTREIPDFMGALVEGYVDDGPVLLGLEIPRTEHAALRTYLRSDGGPQARAGLLDTPFWRKADDQHDGRRSHDMVDLIDAVRLMRVAGNDVAILPYDVASDYEGARDAAMAERIRAAYRALHRGRLLVLSGNVHAMLARPDYAPPEMQVPMGSYLVDLDPYAVNITAHGGRFWACTASCAAVDEFPVPTGSERLDGRVYHLRIVLPRFHVGRLIGAGTAH